MNLKYALERAIHLYEGKTGESISYPELAKRMGMTRQNLHQIIKTNSPGIRTLQSISKELDIELVTLIALGEEK